MCIFVFVCVREREKACRLEDKATQQPSLSLSQDNVSRTPAILVQTMGHASGMAHFYQAADVLDPATGDDPFQGRKRHGVSIHPQFGGWFAFRAAIILRNVQMPDLPSPQIPDPVPSRDDRIQLLNAFNDSWRSGMWRDFGVPASSLLSDVRYSPEQFLYFHSYDAPVKEAYHRLLLQQYVDKEALAGGQPGTWQSVAGMDEEED